MDHWWIDSLLEPRLAETETVTSNVVESEPAVTHLSEASQEIIDYLYSFPHPQGYHNFLEPFIAQFDRVMGNDALVRGLGARLGIWIPIGRAETASDIFIDKILQVISDYGSLIHEEGPTVAGEFPSIPAVVNASRHQLRRWLHGKVDKGTEEELYQDRLFIIASMIAERRGQDIW